MTTVVIPSTVSFIGYLAFEYCTALTSITCLGTTPATLDGGTFNDTNNCPIYVPTDSVDAYKTAWPQYASRIQAIPEVKFFTKITSLDEATSGKYLIVNTSVNKALNSSLIKNSTASSGINANNNEVYVTIHNNTITADTTTINAAADYDADNKTLSWTDSDTQTTYYLYWKGSGVRFEHSGNTQPSMQYPMEAKEIDGIFTIGNSIRNLVYNTTSSRFVFYEPNHSSRYEENMALFKLN